MSRYHQPETNLYFANQMETIVFGMIDEILLLEAQDNYCICDNFRYDTAAYVLNQFRPSYATSLQGALYLNKTILEDSDLQVAIRRAIVTALNKFRATPGCTASDCPLVRRNTANAAT